MKEPTLVIMAAGMGSRFGGLKQITAVDAEGHAIIDFSLFDAYRAGFRKIAFILKREIEESFKAAVGLRMEKYFDVKYVYQQLDKLPEGKLSVTSLGKKICLSLLWFFLPLFILSLADRTWAWTRRFRKQKSAAGQTGGSDSTDKDNNTPVADEG